ncbi:MAG TPA: DUF5671 domain-containing protein [Acidimicrobiia bacterium]|nr:DUF5671 domain-containing protein [Acidimicrobiia bacterium]
MTVLPLLVIAGVALVIILAAQRSKKMLSAKGGDDDILAFLMLALAMTVTGFALVELANTAFPGSRFLIRQTPNEMAFSVAEIVVAAPFVVYFWQRQANRRIIHPESAGWTLYLTVMELILVIAFVVSAVSVIHRIVNGDGPTGWPAPLIFAAIVVFHEVAARNTPPRSDAAELPRVAGSAIGLVTAAIGLGGTLTALFTLIFDLQEIQQFPWWLIAMLVVGAGIWVYRWFRQWDSEPALPRVAWTVLVSIASFASTVAATSAIAVLGLQYILGDTPAPGQHFTPAPVMLGVLLTTLLVWLMHRRDLGVERTNRLRTYEYAVAAVGLVSAVANAVALTVIAFGPTVLAGSDLNAVIGVTVGLVVGLVVWWRFSRRHETGDPGEESVAWPRRMYNLGLGMVFGLVAGGALITTLFVLIRRLLGDLGGPALLTPLAILLYTAPTAWYLLASYRRDQEEIASEAVIAPFEVTIICSHPGMVATRFVPQAHLRVIHRGDGIGVIDDGMADDIVAAVDNQPSLIWVDEDGFRIAPKLVTS